jgi:hypothetical protein
MNVSCLHGCTILANDSLLFWLMPLLSTWGDVAWIVLRRSKWVNRVQAATESAIAEKP